MKKMNFKKGFTLIELLVVIAIIGLLVSIALVSLGAAKNKGADGSIKSNLHTTKLAAEAFFLDNGGSYLPAGGPILTLALGTPCPPYLSSGATNMIQKNKVLADSIAEAVKKGGNGSSCYNSATYWAVAVGLKSSSTTSWCVDTTGTAKMVNSAPGAAINTSTFLCN